jgi:hypothetical protein
MHQLTDFLDHRVDGSVLGIARIILGIAALAKGIIVTGSVFSYQNQELLHFPYTAWGLAVPGGTFANIATMFWMIFAIFFLIGFGTRVSGLLLGLMIFLTIGIDQQLYSNHVYLLGTVVVLMAIADAGRTWSVDARRAQQSRSVPRWAVLLIMLQLTSVYLFAAVTKINEGFLSGAVMERSFEPSMLERVEILMPLEVLAPLAIVTELFLAAAFWHSTARWAALPVGIGFHALNVMIMGHGSWYNLSVFALVMLSMMLVFFTRMEVETERVPGRLEDRPARLSGSGGL